LNAFWTEVSEAGSKDSKLGPEKIWLEWQKIVELDKLQYGALPDGKKPEEWSEGSSLDEFWSHKFLESFGKTLTAIEFRTAFKTIDINFDKKMALVEFLLYDRKQNVDELMKRPQGTNEDLERAKVALKEVQTQIDAIEKQKGALEKKAAGSGVQANAAKNELEQLLTKDNTALNKAVLSAEAAVRKAAKNKTDTPQGALWWLERELAEAKKYKPKKAQ